MSYAKRRIEEELNLNDWETCPRCGRGCWADLGCAGCGLEFFPPSEAYQEMVPLAERVARLRADWADNPPDPHDCDLRNFEISAKIIRLSPIERQFWDAAAQDGWAGLAWNYPVTVEGKRYKIDFAVPEWRFGIELDGHATHSSAEAIARDRERQRRLERAGWTICRFGGREIYLNVTACVHEARAALLRVKEG